MPLTIFVSVLILSSCWGGVKYQVVVPGLESAVLFKGDWRRTDDRSNEFSQEFTRRSGEALQIFSQTLSDTGMAKAKVDEQLFLLRAMFEEKTSPYPGQISENIDCKDLAKGLLVNEIATGDALRIEAEYFANERKVPLACPSPKGNLKARVIWYYCASNQTLYRIRHWWPEHEAPSPLDFRFRSAKCNI